MATGRWPPHGHCTRIRRCETTAAVAAKAKLPWEAEATEGRLRPAERRRVPDGGGECGVAPGARASEESADVDTFNITLSFITLMAH